jgi:cobalt-zinc-cadmium efflux system protein
MAHTHDHNHNAVPEHIGKAFIAGILLNLIYVIVQIGVGLKVHSLALLSDAGHNFADIASLVLSLIAYRLNKVKPNARFTYGYRRTSILVALINSVILLTSIGIISFEAVHRLFHPTPLPGKLIAVVAFFGIIVNGISALFFLSGKDKDLNIKSVFLHLLADALLSAAVVAGGILIYFTHLYWIDSALSILIAIVILISTWKLLADSMKLSLDAVPENINVEEIKKTALGINGIVNIHHLHIWAISTTENAMTGHLVLADTVTIDGEQEIKLRLKHELLHQNIHHITFETERERDNCEGKEC